MSNRQWILLFAVGGLVLPFFGFQFRLLQVFGDYEGLVCLGLIALVGLVSGVGWLLRPKAPRELEEAGEDDPELVASRSIREIGDRRFK